jgi:tRNA-binding EMAP/Myf-like protein
VVRQGRSGAADGPTNARMYDRLIVCQGRTVLDLKKDEVALSVPSSAMVLCVRPAGGDDVAAARTTGSGARLRPPPRQSGCIP